MEAPLGLNTKSCIVPAAAEAAQPELLDVDQLLDFDLDEAPVQTDAAPASAPPLAGKRAKAAKPGTGGKAKRAAVSAAGADAEEAAPAAKRVKTSKGNSRCTC